MTVHCTTPLDVVSLLYSSSSSSSSSLKVKNHYVPLDKENKYIERFAEQRAAGPTEAGEEQESGGEMRGETVGGDARRMGPALSVCLK